MTPTPAPVPVTTRVDNHDRDRDKGAQSATTTPGGNNNGGSGNKKRSQNKMPSGGHAQSLNHLLNFTLPPRQPQGLPPLPRRSRKTASAAAYGVWNKEKFVNAQYRFVMKPTGDYTVHFADPDIFFQWHDILQVIVPRTSALAAASSTQEQQEGLITCPICLSPPSAPRMTKCGHVFCYPCVLHYLNASSETQNWARCPICFDAINEKQLKSVRWYDEPSIQDETMDMPQEASSSSSHVDNNEGDSPRPGSTLRMRLMERPQITTLALPRSATWPSDLIPKHQAPFHFLPDVFRFARFMLATPSYLLAHLSLDLDELSCERRVLSGMKDELSVAFVDTAERKVRQQMEKAAALDTEALKSATARAEQGVRDLERDRGRDERKREQPSKVDQETDNPDNVPAEFLSTQGIIPISASSKPTSVTRNQRRRQNINPPPPSQSAYYFYQAASGASIFLHPLDIRILLSHFGGYSAFPDTIPARVDASSEGAVDADLRRRCKYLGHMPESADVVFVEADLTSVVGEEALRAFEAPLRARRTKRRERGKKDDRARARAEERERAKMRLPPSWALPQPDSAGSAVDYGLLVSMAEAAFERPVTPEEITVDASAPAPAAAAMSTSTPTGGAWGVRTFASAARSPQPQTPIRGQQARGSQGRGQQSARRAELNTDDIDDWEFDAAWHELEAGRATVGGGRRKRANKLVVLGGGGGRRR